MKYSPAFNFSPSPSAGLFFEAKLRFHGLRNEWQLVKICPDRSRCFGSGSGSGLDPDLDPDWIDPLKVH
jgi:hypothetical protein